MGDRIKKSFLWKLLPSAVVRVFPSRGQRDPLSYNLLPTFDIPNYILGSRSHRQYIIYYAPEKNRPPSEINHIWCLYVIIYICRVVIYFTLLAIRLWNRGALSRASEFFDISVRFEIRHGLVVYNMLLAKYTLSGKFGPVRAIWTSNWNK